MPRVLGHIPANRAERVVRDRLREQLPADWVVVSSVAWSKRTKTRSGSGASYVRDGQCDFVVLAPGEGICVVEVKGASRVRVDEKGRWQFDEHGRWRTYDKSPLEQASGNAHDVSALLDGGRGQQGTRFGFVMVFPNGTIVEGPGIGTDRGLVVDKNDLSNLRTRIVAALRARGHTSRADGFTPDLALLYGQRLAGHPFRVDPGEGDPEEPHEGRDVIDTLTRQQYAALSGIFRYPSVAVSGPAGSGKTVLAMWRLRATVDEGRDALFLCFNRSLRDALRSQYPDVAAQIHSVDAYFRDLVNSPGPSGDTTSYFQESLPLQVMLAAEAFPHDEKFDDLILDEAQDFGEYRIHAAKELLRESGHYVCFSDDRQNLYQREALEAVGAQIVFSLEHNCRNTSRINDTCNRATERHVPSMPGMPDGIHPDVRVGADRAAARKAAWNVAAEWVNAGLRVAILSPYKLENSSIEHARGAHNLALATTFDAWVDRSVYYSTIRSFKGLEADGVVLIDLDEPGSSKAFENEDEYVALTRAKLRLAVICRSEAAAERYRRSVAS